MEKILLDKIKKSEPLLYLRLREQRYKCREEAIEKGMNDLFSQEYVAKKLNVDRSTVSKHERGEMPPTVAQFFQYGAIYNCDVYYLMGLTEEEKPFPETIKQEYE